MLPLDQSAVNISLGMEGVPSAMENKQINKKQIPFPSFFSKPDVKKNMF